VTFHVVETPATILALEQEFAQYDASDVRRVIGRVGINRAREMLQVAAQAGQPVALVHFAIDIGENIRADERAAARKARR
jgi:hypothetical protein